MNRPSITSAVGCRLAATVLACLFLLAASEVPSAAEPPPLPPEIKIRVNRSIDAGVQFLLRSQGPGGTWATEKTQSGHAVGYAALPGLVLLECGVPANKLIEAARFRVLSAAPKLAGTYECALSILFLDRLGNKKDRPTIQMLAVRLLAGQRATGGWGYDVPVLKQDEHNLFLSTLARLEPPYLENVIAGKFPLLDDPFGPNAKGNLILKDPRDSKPADKLPGDPGYARRFIPGMYAGEGRDDEPRIAQAGPRNWTWCMKMQQQSPNASAGIEAKNPGSGRKPWPAIRIPAQFASMAVMHEPGSLLLTEAKDRTTDNSNTQFAVLALWAARREIPIARTLHLLQMRFCTSQNANGSWGYAYHFGGGDENPALTVVGLLSMAAGHALAREMHAKGEIPDLPKNQRVIDAFAALSKHIGQPSGRLENLPMQNLYFLWSVERAGVLYKQDLIANKDWYRWGAEILIANQTEDGSWDKGAYTGSSPVLDTCFALLFLQRANLLKDLAAQLPDPAILTQDINAKLDLKPNPIPIPTPIPEPLPKTEPEPKVDPPPRPKIDPTPKENPKIDPPAPNPVPNPTPTTKPPAQQPTQSSSTPPVLLWVFVGLGVLVIGVAGCLLLFGNKKTISADDDSDEGEEDDEDEKPRKKKPRK